MRKLFPSTLFVLCSLSAATAFAYGEGADIPIEARAIHLLTNEARCNTHEALASCGTKCGEAACYDESMGPVYWNDNLFHSAQFHTNMLDYLKPAAQWSWCMQHDSPCVLKSTVAQDFPDRCDGNPSCACEGGTATCDTVGTKTFDRIRMFGTPGSSENLASVSNPLRTFNLWLFENSTSSVCAFSSSNGHRWSILNKNNKAVGVGYGTSIATQDYASSSSETSAISSGAHYLDDKTLWFKMHYYASADAVSATVNVGGTCTNLQKTRGTGSNGVWGTSSVAAPAKCTPYFFEVKDKTGKVTRFPTTGSILYDCDTKKSWSSETGDSCFGDEPPERPCGNGVINEGEQCDGTALNGATCATVKGSGSTGELLCNDTCTGYDSSRCSSVATMCGNNRRDGNELCDGNDLNNATCASVVGKGSTGTLACNDSCSGYETKECTAAVTCGNNKIDGNELCDGSDLNNATCASVVGTGSTGTLACNDSCSGYETTGCTAAVTCTDPDGCTTEPPAPPVESVPEKYASDDSCSSSPLVPTSTSLALLGLLAGLGLMRRRREHE